MRLQSIQRTVTSVVCKVEHVGKLPQAPRALFLLTQLMCAEQELVVGNSSFKKNDVYKYTWLREAEGRVVDKALMEYVLLPRRMLGRPLDVKVWRGERGGDCLTIFWWKLC